MGFVYYFKHNRMQGVKIGMTNDKDNVLNRFNNFKTNEKGSYIIQGIEKLIKENNGEIKVSINDLIEFFKDTYTKKEIRDTLRNVLKLKAEEKPIYYQTIFGTGSTSRVYYITYEDVKSV